MLLLSHIYHQHNFFSFVSISSPQPRKRFYKVPCGPQEQRRGMTGPGTTQPPGAVSRRSTWTSSLTRLYIRVASIVSSCHQGHSCLYRLVFVSSSSVLSSRGQVPLRHCFQVQVRSRSNSQGPHCSQHVRHQHFFQLISMFSIHRYFLAPTNMSFRLSIFHGFLNQEAKPTTACLYVSCVLFQFWILLDFLLVFIAEVYS